MATVEEEIEILFEGIQRQLNQDWSKFRDQYHNPSNKGASYEQALGNLFEKYFRGVYEIQTEAVIVDHELDVFEVFDTTRGENEIDVIGLFESARPRILFEVEELTYVPLKGAAFLCEVKSEIDASRLEKDLQKLEKVTRLIDFEDKRWGMSMTGSYSTSHQIRCLVYDENSISEDTLTNLVIEYGDAWDLLLIVEDDTLLINSSLPIYEDLKLPLADLEEINEDAVEVSGDEKYVGDAVADLRSLVRRERSFVRRNYGLVMFLIVLSGSIPRPLGVDTTDVLTNLVNRYQRI